MPQSELTRSVGSVRNTPVANYSASSFNSTRHVPYRALIAVSPFLLVLSVSDFIRSLWRCGQLWPYVGRGSLGTRLHRDCNAMWDGVKISPHIPSTCVQNEIFSLLMIRDCKVMGDAVNISSHVPSTCTQNAIVSLLIIHILPSRQIYVAIENPSLFPSVTCPTTSSNLWNDLRADDNSSHAENLQSNGCQCFSEMNKFRDGIEVTWVFRYCGERQG